MPCAILPGLLASASGGGLADIDLALAVSTFVVFVIFAFVLGRFAWGPLLEIVETREKTIHEQVEGAEKAQTEAQALLHKRQDMLKDATREREEIIARATKEAEEVKAELLGKARSQAEQVLAKARDRFEQEKKRAVLDLRAEVADLAMAAAEKIVRSSLTPEARRKLVDETIAALPRAQ